MEQVIENDLFKSKLLPNGWMRFEHKCAGVVILPVTMSGKILLIEQYRPAVYCTQLELPRGNCLANEEPAVAVKRELFEETGCTATEVTFLGKLHSDDGCTTDNTSAFIASIHDDSNVVLQEKESINGYKFVSKDELISIIANQEITDNFTLSAIAIYLCRSYI